ncbi:hypothetical protein LTR01_001354 [Friedmanniomyces endolithicus]|nr:hypothetical protein LTS09_001785 [Friedmanniomyces endolithicus]KAK0314531.1 hypothetical protein LTR01_001354 [Friedmanniomyces endolithicus]KAK0827668.1 hypothetical protein LTR73_005270 [Friedmanniomyces endolithicus]
MTTQEQHDGTAQQSRAVLGPSFKVGAACGCAGFLFGGTSGILKGTTPFLFATAASIQTFALGTTFWACRSTILRTTFSGEQLQSDLLKASSFAGGLSGGLVAAITRGRRSVLPATLMWSLFGGIGQLAYNGYATGNVTRQISPPEDFWTKMARQSWFPLKALSNEEYSEMLREKMLKVDVEIALLDDRIAALGKQQQEDIAIIEASRPEPSP